jgi:DNA-directed RNA polymerase subunit RPC12/RpoP
MQDGLTQCANIAVVCPKCGQESVVRVATGAELDTQRKSITCAYCSNPWTEFLPGQLVSGPEKFPEPLQKN